MTAVSRIEWTEQTWNPTVGCTKISPGCANCYAESMAKRLKAMGVSGYENGFELTLLPKRLNEPLARKKPTTYFVNSMSDVFHESVPFTYIDQLFDVIRATPRHTYQVLTKRAQRMAEYFAVRKVPDNAWVGVTVEDREYGLPRIQALQNINAKVRMISAEPLLQSLGTFDLDGIHWMIVGGESGPNARPMKKEWVDEVRIQCEQNNVAFFFKQWGGWGVDGIKRQKKLNGRMLDGRTWDQTPTVKSA
jgi:protein gp37